MYTFGMDFIQIPNWPNYRINRDGIVESGQCEFSTIGEHTIKWTKVTHHLDATKSYRVINFYKHGKAKHFYLHRLLAIVFIPNPNNYPVVCHNDGDSQNNNIENLRWDTQKNNLADCKKHGTKNYGERNGSAKLTDGQVIEIRRQFERGMFKTELAKKYGVCYTSIKKIIIGKTWKNI